VFITSLGCDSCLGWRRGTEFSWKPGRQIQKKIPAETLVGIASWTRMAAFNRSSSQLKGAQKRPQTSCYESQASRLRVVQLLFFPKRCLLIRSVSSRVCQSVGHGIMSFISFPRSLYLRKMCNTLRGRIIRNLQKAVQANPRFL